MDSSLKVAELLLTVLEQNNQILGRIEKIENKLFNIKPKTNDFEIDTFKKASKIARCSIPTLRQAVKSGILKKDIDYKHNGNRKYLFSTSSLEKIKGTL